MITFYDNQAQARADAQAKGLREKVLCFVVRGEELLVFDHVPDGGSGVQVPAGGVEAGETPDQTAMRELWEESGLTLQDPLYLVSYLWHGEPPEAFVYPVQVAHAYTFAAPLNTPDAWQHHADDHLFSFRWANVQTPKLDWEMDAALPTLLESLSRITSPP